MQAETRDGGPIRGRIKGLAETAARVEEKNRLFLANAAEDIIDNRIYHGSEQVAEGLRFAKSFINILRGRDWGDSESNLSTSKVNQERLAKLQQETQGTIQVMTTGELFILIKILMTNGPPLVDILSSLPKTQSREHPRSEYSRIRKADDHDI
jgi:hypothetical protein